MASRRRIIDDKLLETLVHEASATEHSVLRRLLRLPVKARCAARVDAVLAAHGLVPEREPESRAS
jgi:hypothetical protein